MMLVNVVKDIPNVQTHIIFNVLSNHNAPPLILINTTINFCDFMADPSRNLFLKSFYDMQYEESNLPKGCPIKKVY